MSPLEEFFAQSMPRLKGQIAVIKYGGSFMDSSDPKMRERVAQQIPFLRMMGLSPVIVHGGGKAITRAMEQAGLRPEFVQGMRVTDEATMKVVEQTLSYEINPEIVAMTSRLGHPARGFSGTEVFRCRKLSPDGSGGEKIDLGFVGDVTDVDAALLRQTIAQGQIPVISPTAIGPEGKLYNCNADVAAAHTAIALKASWLIFMSDVPGLLRDPKAPQSVLSVAHAREIEQLKKSGVIDKGMIPKVDSALAACRAGVEKVLFIDGRQADSLFLSIMASEPIGTRIVP